MTAFNERENAMMWGIYAELETLNRTLTGLRELLERQEERAKDSETPKPIEPGPHARIMGERRRQGLCLVCGATREMADKQRRTTGAGCYKWAPAPLNLTYSYAEVWAPHSWPEDTPR